MEQYHIFKRTVNYYETDKMQVVHHSNYIRYLEECRMDFMKQMHLSYDKMEEKKIMIPVLSVSCEYKSPARFPDTICVIPKLTGFRGVKFDMEYRIYSEDLKTLLTTATSSHCFVDFDFKPIRLKRDYPEFFDTMNRLVGVDLVPGVWSESEKQ